MLVIKCKCGQGFWIGDDLLITLAEVKRPAAGGSLATLWLSGPRGAIPGGLARISLGAPASFATAGFEVVQILDIRGQTVKFGIDAPPDRSIVRTDVRDAVA